MNIKMMCKCYEASYKLAKKVRKKENPNQKQSKNSSMTKHSSSTDTCTN